MLLVALVDLLAPDLLLTTGDRLPSAIPVEVVLISLPIQLTLLLAVVLLALRALPRPKGKGWAVAVGSYGLACAHSFLSVLDRDREVFRRSELICSPADPAPLAVLVLTVFPQMAQAVLSHNLCRLL